MKKKGEIRLRDDSDDEIERRRVRPIEEIEREMKETGWRLKKTRMGTSGLY
jgi:hypothetical protein